MVASETRSLVFKDNRTAVSSSTMNSLVYSTVFLFEHVKIVYNHKREKKRQKKQNKRKI